MLENIFFHIQKIYIFIIQKLVTFKRSGAIQRSIPHKKGHSLRHFIKLRNIKLVDKHAGSTCLKRSLVLVKKLAHTILNITIFVGSRKTQIWDSTWCAILWATKGFLNFWNRPTPLHGIVIWRLPFLLFNFQIFL